MIVLSVFVVLGIVFTGFMVYVTKDDENITKPLLWVMPAKILVLIFLLISVITPAQYEKIKFEAECELTSLSVNCDYDVYVTLNENNYICCLNDGTNKPIKYPINSVTSIVYIDENETPKICKCVQANKWTWYAAPIYGDKVSYVLYIPDGSIFYGSVK